jgi:hypothetical protein
MELNLIEIVLLFAVAATIAFLLSRMKSDSAVGRRRFSDIRRMNPRKLILLANEVSEIRLVSFTFML